MITVRIYDINGKLKLNSLNTKTDINMKVLTTIHTNKEGNVTYTKLQPT